MDQFWRVVVIPIHATIYNNTTIPEYLRRSYLRNKDPMNIKDCYPIRPLYSTFWMPLFLDHYRQYLMCIKWFCLNIDNPHISALFNYANATEIVNKDTNSFSMLWIYLRNILALLPIYFILSGGANRPRRRLILLHVQNNSIVSITCKHSELKTN